MSESVQLNEVEELWVTSNYSMRPPTPADLIAAVRRGVESGTIKGEVEWRCLNRRGASCSADNQLDSSETVGHLHRRCGPVLVIPVSDGGSET